MRKAYYRRVVSDYDERETSGLVSNERIKKEVRAILANGWSYAPFDTESNALDVEPLDAAQILNSMDYDTSLYPLASYGSLMLSGCYPQE